MDSDLPRLVSTVTAEDEYQIHTTCTGQAHEAGWTGQSKTKDIILFYAFIQWYKKKKEFTSLYI